MFEVTRQQSRMFLQRYRCNKRIGSGQGCARPGKLIAVYPCNACRLLCNLPVDQGGKKLVPDWPIYRRKPGKKLCNIDGTNTDTIPCFDELLNTGAYRLTAFGVVYQGISIEKIGCHRSVGMCPPVSCHAPFCNPRRCFFQAFPSLKWRHPAVSQPLFQTL